MISQKDRRIIGLACRQYVKFISGLSMFSVDFNFFMELIKNNDKQFVEQFRLNHIRTLSEHYKNIDISPEELEDYLRTQIAFQRFFNNLILEGALGPKDFTLLLENIPSATEIQFDVIIGMLPDELIGVKSGDHLRLDLNQDTYNLWYEVFSLISSNANLTRENINKLSIKYPFCNILLCENIANRTRQILDDEAVDMQLMKLILYVRSWPYVIGPPLPNGSNPYIELIRFINESYFEPSQVSYDIELNLEDSSIEVYIDNYLVNVIKANDIELLSAICEDPKAFGFSKYAIQTLEADLPEIMH